MAVFTHPDFSDHEGVFFASDPKTKFQAIIAVHSTVRGPSAGGTRFWHYETEEQALSDVLRLSKAMSYKNAAANLRLGGGKAVLIYPKGEFDRKALFEAYGRAIETLNGRYITAEDVGVSPDDMRVIKTQTDYVAGLETGKAASGDPSPITAEGVFRGLKAGAAHIWDNDNLVGKKVAIQGLGSVGYSLCEKLFTAGAEIYVSDINNEILAKAERRFAAKIVDIDEIHKQPVDIFAPCALGGALSASSVPQIQAKLIGGAANNQLVSPDVMELLDGRAITYLPDFVLNAGGIINIAAEVSGEYNPSWVEQKLDELRATIETILEKSKEQNLSTLAVANNIAERRLQRGRTQNLKIGS